jgi:hypothetical protein
MVMPSNKSFQATLVNVGFFLPAPCKLRVGEHGAGFMERA